jgi:hypothetical protein
MSTVESLGKTARLFIFLNKYAKKWILVLAPGAAAAVQNGGAFASSKTSVML